MLRLVLFDMDGVIFEGKNFWLDLHKLMGTEKQAWQLWKGLGTRAYERLSDRTAKIWQNQSSEHFWRLISERRTVEGLEQVFAYLHECQINTAIISSGPYQLAEKAQRLFSIDEIRANKLGISEDGTFTGIVKVQVDDNYKNIPAKEVMLQFGATYDTTAMIGDASSDVLIARLVSLSIAYNSNDTELLNACKYKVEDGEISKIVVSYNSTLNSYQIVARSSVLMYA